MIDVVNEDTMTCNVSDEQDARTAAAGGRGAAVSVASDELVGTLSLRYFTHITRTFL